LQHLIKDGHITGGAKANEATNGIGAGDGNIHKPDVLDGRAVSSAKQAHLVLVAVDGEIRNCVIAAVERAC